jgi:hypothetical protein
MLIIVLSPAYSIQNVLEAKQKRVCIHNPTLILLDLLAFRKSARMLHDVYGGGN